MGRIVISDISRLTFIVPMPNAIAIANATHQVDLLAYFFFLGIFETPDDECACIGRGLCHSLGRVNESICDSYSRLHIFSRRDAEAIILLPVMREMRKVDGF